MNVLLIQTSGAKISNAAAPSYVEQAKGPRFCDEPLQHMRYFNAEPFWRHGFLRRRAWQKASEGDIAILYSTGSVSEHPSSLSHVLTVSEKQILDGEGAWLEFSHIIELEPKINHNQIQDLIDGGRFSKGMGDCGREGFNLRPVDRDDFVTLKKISDPATGSWNSRI